MLENDNDGDDVNFSSVISIVDKNKIIKYDRIIRKEIRIKRVD
jgi:hypothetical protein